MMAWPVVRCWNCAGIESLGHDIPTADGTIFQHPAIATSPYLWKKRGTDLA
jgi:hypothetical protein